MTNQKRTNGCPYCGAKIVCSCRCPKSDSECENGHNWHYCLAHDEPKLVEGESDHKLSINQCTCKTSVAAVLAANSDDILIPFKISKK